MSGDALDRRRLEESAVADIRRVIGSSKHVLDELQRHHERLVSRVGVVPGSDSAQAPSAELSAHCIGLGRALVALIADDFGAHALPILRALREAHELLEAVLDPDEPQVAAGWAEGRDVRPKKVRAALDRTLRRTLEAMRRRGDQSADVVDPDWLRRASEGSYANLSAYAHHRREAVSDLHALASGTYCYGREPSVARRYAIAVEAYHALLAASIQIGLALGGLTADDEFISREIKPLLASLDAAHPDVDYLKLLLATHTAGT
jgi:hypothetical protein